MEQDKVAKAITALEQGDFSFRTSGDDEESQRLNRIFEMLSEASREFKRISREIGDEGRFGGQAVVPSATGEWKEMLDSFNRMAYNLTDQVRDIARTTKTMAAGTKPGRVTVPANGETLELKEALNVLVEKASLS